MSKLSSLRQLRWPRLLVLGARGNIGHTPMRPGARRIKDSEQKLVEEEGDEAEGETEGDETEGDEAGDETEGDEAAAETEDETAAEESDSETS